MNPLIVTIILAIFGASWLNQQAMNKRIDDLKGYLDSRFDGLEKSFTAEFKAVGAEIGTVRSEVTNLAQRVDRIERQLDQVFKPTRT